MYLMIDPGLQLRTFLDALYVGYACDEANYFWYEDPYRAGQRRLRQLATSGSAKS